MAFLVLYILFNSLTTHTYMHDPVHVFGPVPRLMPRDSGCNMNARPIISVDKLRRLAYVTSPLIRITEH